MVKPYDGKRKVKTAQGGKKIGAMWNQTVCWGAVSQRFTAATDAGSVDYYKGLDVLVKFWKDPPPIYPETELAFAKWILRNISFSDWFILKHRGLECACVLVRQVRFSPIGARQGSLLTSKWIFGCDSLTESQSNDHLLPSLQQKYLQTKFSPCVRN